MACDVDVGSQGHQRDVSPVLSAHLVFDLRQLSVGISGPQTIQFINTSHCQDEVSIGNCHCNDFSESDIVSSVMVEQFSPPGVTPGGYVRKSGINV